MNLDIRPEEIDYLLANLDNLSVEEQAETLQILETLEARAAAQRAHDDLIEFCKQIWPDYKVGAHHRLLAKILMAVERGEKDRVTVSIAPRFGKSMLVSTAFPAWYIGRNPTKKIIITSHKADLAVDFGRQVRNIVGSDKFKAIFPGVSLAVDSKSAGRWNTNHGGVFNALGVGGAIAGIGGDIILCLAGNTLIPTEIGVRELRTVQIGDKIHTRHGLREVTGKMLTTHSRTITINGHVEGSSSHRFMTHCGEWVEMADLRVGDKIKTVTIWRRLWRAISGFCQKPQRTKRGAA